MSAIIAYVMNFVGMAQSGAIGWVQLSLPLVMSHIAMSLLSAYVR